MGNTKRIILQQGVSNAPHDVHDMPNDVDRVEGDATEHEEAKQSLQDRLAHANLEQRKWKHATSKIKHDN